MKSIATPAEIHREDPPVQSPSEVNLQDIDGFDQASAGIACLGADCNILCSNEKFLQMLGYEEDELGSLDISTLMPDIARQQFRLDITSLATGQRDFFTTTCVFLQKNNSPVHAQVTVSPVWQPDSGQLKYLLAVIHDTSEQSRLEEQYRSNQSQSNKLLNWSRTLQQATDYDDLLHMVRDEMRDSTGYRNTWIYTFDDSHAKTIQIMSIGSENEATVKTNFATLEVGDDPFLQELVASEVPVIVEDARTDPRTNKQIVEQLQNRTLIMIPLYFLGQKRGSLGIGTFGEEGCKVPTKSELEYIVSMTGHISAAIERIKFVDEVRQNQLKQMELEKKLQQSQKMEAIGQLTGGIAHDFNNILASIIGFTELASYASNSPNPQMNKLNNYLDEVMVAGKRARDLIAQMLAFSRGANSEWCMISIDTVIKETIKMLRSSLPSSFQIYMELDENLPQIKSDVVKLNQIFMNLCINAKDATDGTGAVRISARVINDSAQACSACGQAITGEFLAVEVIDNGSGIPPDIVHRIFDPFFTTKEVGRGTGMGLSMVHGIMHEHHGHILLQTSSAEGTSFTLLFPLEQQAAIIEPAPDTLVHDVDPATAELPLIMVVDDEISVAKFLRELIQEYGYRVAIETNSQEALAAFQRAPDSYQLVITDQTMPGISGVELFENINKIRQDCPVIICTGNSESIPETYAREIGIQGYCTKPIETKLLMAQIGHLTKIPRGPLH